jgi:predicted anti-sigma-YlaC factor YlaD
MMCEKLRSEFMEAVLSGLETASPQMQEHLRSCSSCARELSSFQQTMSLLDEWQTPEPSPYFSSRLRVRMRSAETAQPVGWLAWLRRPVVAAAAVVLIAVGTGLLEIGRVHQDSNTLATNDQPGVARVNSTPGTAVGDLQYLDKNADLFSDFDALDGQPSTE